MVLKNMFRKRLILGIQLRQTKDQVSLILVLNEFKGEAGGSATTLGFRFLADNFLNSFIEEHRSLNILEFGSAKEGSIFARQRSWMSRTLCSARRFETSR